MADSSVMRGSPHDRTWIATIRDHLEAWRRENHWSRETLVQQIVEAHDAAGLDRVSGIRFEPRTADEYNRMKVNAERVYRWLDDHSKDKNLLPANFIPSILLGLPLERRAVLTDALLLPAGIGAIEIPASAPRDEPPLVMHFQAIVSTSADAEVAVSNLLDGISAGEAETAHHKLGRSLAVIRRALSSIGRLINGRCK